MSTPQASPVHTNRLIHESSPYLLQHAHNPVDWYAWGPEAFEAARSQNKPIFLSVGYSTCYWCHVMERQSFENPLIAKVMNEKFINIKVDREERPDVDQLYMTAVQAMTQQGGWPMSVFLTPELKPFWGGTYFPPSDAYGRPGFLSVLNSISDHFHRRPEQIERATEQLVEILNRVAEPASASARITVDEAFIEDLIKRSTADYEPMYGGFGSAPKFPRETVLELLLSWTAKPRSGQVDTIAKMVRHALDAMANGGIRDHLGGGFHRYSTDAKWLVPHFEIMLYDNAMLGWCYTEAYRQTRETRYATVARGIFDFILREMTSASGAFYTAFDAEVDAQEGLSYLWTRDEIAETLGEEDANAFCAVYGVDLGANFADPHHGAGAPDKNILYLPEGPAMESDFRIVQMRRKLYEARRKRKQPLLDTKVLTSWNALMIRALAFGAKELLEPHYYHAAAAAAEFLLKHHRKSDGSVFRTSRLDASPPSPAKLDGFLDDYACLVQALLELHQSSNEPRWLAAAREIQKQMIDRFYDHDRGGFFFTDRGASDLIVRQKVASDSPLPNGNAIATRVAIALDDQEVASKTITLFADQIQAHGEGMSAMVQAAMEYVTRHGPITVEPSQESQQRPQTPQQIAESVITLAARWLDPRQLALLVRIAPPWHINTDAPAKNLLATELRSDRADLIESIDYPPGEEQRFAFSDEALRVYSGEIQIGVRFREPVTDALQMSLHYQPCDESTCLAPVTKRFEIPAPT